jgi:hypothetical protein
MVHTGVMEQVLIDCFPVDLELSHSLYHRLSRLDWGPWNPWAMTQLGHYLNELRELLFSNNFEYVLAKLLKNGEIINDATNERTYNLVASHII